MVIFLFIALFCIALIITLIGSHLSPRSWSRTKRSIADPSRPRRGAAQGDHVRDVRRKPIADPPYRQSRRSYASMEYAEVEEVQGRRQSRNPAPKNPNLRAQTEPLTTSNRQGCNKPPARDIPSPYEPSTQRYLDRLQQTPPPHRRISTHRGVDEGFTPSRPLRSPRRTGGEGVADLGLPVTNRQTKGEGPVGLRSPVALWRDHTPHWLKLTLLTGTIFSLCLLLFIQMANFGLTPAMAIMNSIAPQPTPVPVNSTLYGENLSLSGASKSLV